MSGFICFYNSKQIEVYADSQYAAKVKAIALFKAPKSKQHMISVMLAEQADGTEVVHTFA